MRRGSPSERGAQWACARAAPVRSRPAPASRGSPEPQGKVRPHFTSASFGFFTPSSSVTPPRRALYPSGGAKRTGDAVNPRSRAGGRRSTPPDSQRTRPLPQAQAQPRGAGAAGPHPHRRGGHQRPAGAQLSPGQLWRVGEEALGSGSGLSQPLAHKARPPSAARLEDALWARELRKGEKLSDFTCPAPEYGRLSRGTPLTSLGGAHRCPSPGQERQVSQP